MGEWRCPRCRLIWEAVEKGKCPACRYCSPYRMEAEEWLRKELKEQEEKAQSGMPKEDATVTLGMT